ncbi:hypothetical protein TNCV_2910471 [Trichonephila clavipes]|nr:hypothetical protein TNCV_2910471 [Trichonephila clavipes]
MDDNARPHLTLAVEELLESEDITRMDCPAYSPDLNPIEHVSDVFDGFLYGAVGSTYRKWYTEGETACRLLAVCRLRCNASRELRRLLHIVYHNQRASTTVITSRKTVATKMVCLDK